VTEEDILDPEEFGTPVNLEPPRADETTPAVQFGMTVEGMDQREFVILMSRSELEVIRKELDALVDQIQATRQALKLKHADKAILTARAEDLRAAFHKTKKRREELSDFRGDLHLERAVKTLDELKEKRSKLEEMKGTLDKSVYKEQKKKIADAIKNVEKGFKSSIKDAENWLKSMSKTSRTLQQDGSRLEARHRIGDVSPRQYETERAGVERSLKTLEIARSILDEVLVDAKKKK
jgi:chromosome segregation ATPase